MIFFNKLSLAFMVGIYPLYVNGVTFITPTTIDIDRCDVFAGLPEENLQKSLALVLQDVSVGTIKKRARVAKSCGYNSLAHLLGDYAKKKIAEESTRQAALPLHQRLRLLAQRSAQFSKGLFFIKIGAVVVAAEYAPVLFGFVKNKATNEQKSEGLFENLDKRELVKTVQEGATIFFKEFVYPIFVPNHYEMSVVQSGAMKLDVKVWLRKSKIGFKISCEL